MRSGIWYRRAPPNNRMNPTLPISALINGSTRIAVSCLAEVLATHPQSGLCEPIVSRRKEDGDTSVEQADSTRRSNMHIPTACDSAQALKQEH